MVVSLVELLNNLSTILLAQKTSKLKIFI